jgi:hypothetical protein
MFGVFQRLYLRRQLRRTAPQRAEARRLRQIVIRRLQEVTRPEPPPVPAISFEHALDRLIIEAYQVRQEA